MDSGSNQSSPTQQSTTVSELPEWAKPYAQKTLAKAESLTDQPYQAYNAPRIAGFSPDQLTAQQQARQMGPASQIGTASGLASAVGLGAMGTQYQPGQFQNQFQAPGQYTPGQFAMMQAQAPQLTQFQMGGPERVRTGSFTRPGTAEAYMSPYIEQAIAPQLREAQRSSDILGTQMAGQAVRSGAFGGSRAGLLEAERERNLATQMGDIRARGLQSAYEQAQQLYGTEQQRALQAALANQQAGLQVGGQNLQALLGVQQLGAGQNLQAQLANQQMLQAAQQAAEQSRQFGAGQGLQAAGLGAQYGQAAQQLGEQSRQFGANLGMQGLTTGLQAAGQLGQLGQTQYGQEMGINQLLNQYGQQQQALQQQGLSQAYQDFLNQQNYPYKQLGFMSDLIRGLPLGQQSAQQIYQAPGSMMGQLAGLGMGTYGLSRLMAKEGGLMESYADGGEIKGYAGDEGSVTSSSFEESALDDIRYDNNALQKAKQAALDRRDMEVVDYIDKLLAENASMRSGLGNAFDQLPFSTQENIVRAAGGGILAFADRGVVKSDEPTAEEIEAAKKPFIGTPMIVRPRGKEYGESGFFKGLSEFLVPSTYAVDKKSTEASLAPSADDMAAFDRATADYMASRAKPAASTAAPAKAAPADGGIKDALKIMAQTHGMPESDLSALYDREYAKISAENKPLLDRLNKAIEKSAGRADKARSEALPKALAEFGFQWAASAAKPGARFVGSAAMASPTLAASAAESRKAIDRAEDLQNQMQMEQAKFEMALKKGDRATAMQSVSNIRQMQIAMQQLRLQAQQIAQTGAYQQAALKQRGEQFGQLIGVREKTAQAALAQAETARKKVESVARQKFESEVAPRLNREFTSKYGKNWTSLPAAQAEFNQKKEEYIGGQSATPSATPFSSLGLSDTEMKYVFGTE